MSSNWQALHAQLAASINRRSNAIHFHQLAESSPSLSRFRQADALISWLKVSRATADQKNAVLLKLVTVAATDEPGSSGVTEVLLLALWPGLDAIRNRLRRYYPGRLSELDCELLGRLTTQIQTAKARHVRRVAATLLRNVERDLRRALIAQAEIHTSHDDIDAVFDLASVAPHEPISQMIGRSRDLIGADGPLLVLVHIGGCSQLEAAHMLGISHEAARKRCQRAMARLAAKYPVVDVPVAPLKRLSSSETSD